MEGSTPEIVDDVPKEPHVDRLGREGLSFPDQPLLLTRPVVQVHELHGPLGMRHHAEHLAVLGGDARDVRERAVRVIGELSIRRLKVFKPRNTRNASCEDITAPVISLMP